MPRRHLTLLAALATTVASTALAQPTPQLDYARATAQGTMVHVPYQGMTRGPIYFTRYQEELTGVGVSGDLRRLFVNLVPTAYRDGTYLAFVGQPGIVDAKVLPVPAYGRCEPTQQVKDLLAFMPQGYRPSILAGNWPFACTLSLWFLPENEQAVRDTLAASHGIVLTGSIPLCASTSPRVDSPAIAMELSVRGAASYTGGGAVVGDETDVLYATTVLAEEQPALFGTADPKDGWTALMGVVTRDAQAQTLAIPAYYVRNPLYVCAPAPLQLAY